jgi:hypothetical protein
MTSSSSAGSVSGQSPADTFFAACGAGPEPDIKEPVVNLRNRGR